MIKGKIKDYLPIDWNITTNRFVGFIDIMGFKDMVAKNSNEKIYKMMERLSENLKANQIAFGVETDEYGEDLLLKMMTYSDSIMIYSKDDSKKCFENFILAISSLCEDLFTEKIPHKGAIAFGKMTLDFNKSIFFGQPLIDAYLLQEELNFYGIIFHASAESKIYGLPGEMFIHEYLCPFKNGSANHYVIYPMSLTSKKSDVIIGKVAELKSITSGSLRKYIDNTLKYLSSIHSSTDELNQ